MVTAGAGSVSKLPGMKWRASVIYGHIMWRPCEHYCDYADEMNVGSRRVDCLFCGSEQVDGVRQWSLPLGSLESEYEKTEGSETCEGFKMKGRGLTRGLAGQSKGQTAPHWANCLLPQRSIKSGYNLKLVTPVTLPVTPPCEEGRQSRCMSPSLRSWQTFMFWLRSLLCWGFLWNLCQIHGRCVGHEQWDTCLSWSAVISYFLFYWQRLVAVKMVVEHLWTPIDCHLVLNGCCTLKAAGQITMFLLKALSQLFYFLAANYSNAAALRPLLRNHKRRCDHFLLNCAKTIHKSRYFCE